MNMDEVRYFLAVYEDGSMARASERLYISPQGLSRSLKRFETKLGVRLFVRTAQGVIPTEQAVHLKDMFSKMADAEDEAYRYLADLKKSTRTRYLVGRDSMLGDVICKGVADYNELHPDSRIEVTMMREPEDRLARVFLEGGYDYRFLSDELDPMPDLPKTELFEYTFIPLVNKDSPVAKRGIVRDEDFRNLTVLGEYASFTWVKILEQRLQRQGIEIKFRETDKEYIARLLSKPGDNIVFIRFFDRELPLWNSDMFVVPKQENPLTTSVVLQTVHPTMDEDLVRCIQHRLRNSEYGKGSEWQ